MLQLQWNMQFDWSIPVEDPISRTQSMPVRRLGVGQQHLTCERAYYGYEIVEDQTILHGK
jgi:hypothetical protein